jgi:hypothetical protein
LISSFLNLLCHEFILSTITHLLAAAAAAAAAAIRTDNGILSCSVNVYI